MKTKLPISPLEGEMSGRTEGGASHYLRHSPRQLLLNHLRRTRHQLPGMVEAQHHHPVEDVAWPFAVRQQRLRVGAEGLDELGQLAMVPGDQDRLAVAFGREGRDEVLDFTVGEALID